MKKNTNFYPETFFVNECKKLNKKLLLILNKKFKNKTIKIYSLVQEKEGGNHDWKWCTIKVKKIKFRYWYDNNPLFISFENKSYQTYGRWDNEKEVPIKILK